MKGVPVTDLVDYGDIDGESLELHECICGAKFEPWAMILSIYEDSATPCPRCSRKFYFRGHVTVYEMEGPEIAALKEENELP